MVGILLLFLDDKVAAVIKRERRWMDYYSEPGLLSVGFTCKPWPVQGMAEDGLRVGMEHTPKMMTKKESIFQNLDFLLGCSTLEWVRVCKHIIINSL